MNKRNTFSADEALIDEASAAAKAQNTTLNDLARQWLAQYVRGAQPVPAGERSGRLHQGVGPTRKR